MTYWADITITPRQARAAAIAIRAHIANGHHVEEWIDLERLATKLENPVDRDAVA